MKKLVFVSLILGVLFYGCSDPTKINESDTQEVRTLKTNCAAGDLESCANLGVKYALGQEVKKDMSGAKSLFEKSCQGGNPTGCYNLGVIDRDNKSYKKAMQNFETSCEKGFGQSCYSIGVMYKNAEGVDQDLDHAASMFSQACSLNNVYGCNDGCAYYKDDAQGDRALPLCQKACELGNGAGCFNASDLYFNKYQDIQNTIAYAKRACDLGVAQSCSNVGFLYAEGKQTHQDINAALTYFDKGCKLGAQDACSNYQNIQAHLQTKQTNQKSHQKTDKKSNAKAQHNPSK
ncbi:hypothetical protein BKH46_02050 [Helicobacter sp. 12S02634-8]|uniref:tetratricopeptide repeat protein n=1 Tax=Helicobacter sp. 12S02634-8 TaxID=1476199 RepID=UPI000BA5EFFB|nr:tetratricopeptide repeat protein [Helicobacter sp. 12S02634-8]PAF48116.1 hypothetical protein BKH46_02050 [Helicobacter sp. 12S02634-8]